MEEGWKYFFIDLSLFVLLFYTNFLNKLKFNDLKKTIFLLTWTYFFQSTKSPHFPLRGKVGQLSKMKREICWSTVSMVLVYGGAARRCRCLNNFPTFSCQHAPHFIFSPLLQFGEYRDFSGTGGSACKTAFALSRPVKCSDTAESCCMSCQHLCTVCSLAPPSLTHAPHPPSTLSTCVL